MSKIFHLKRRKSLSKKSVKRKKKSKSLKEKLRKKIKTKKKSQQPSLIELVLDLMNKTSVAYAWHLLKMESSSKFWTAHLYKKIIIKPKSIFSMKSA